MCGGKGPGIGVVWAQGQVGKGSWGSRDPGTQGVGIEVQW